ncbi:MAG: hypothetical protein ABI480_01835 [Chitinophagaceae bacterium]
MKFRYLTLLSLLVGGFFIAGCKHNVDEKIKLPNPNDGNTSAPVTASLTGLVVDENNNPAVGVTVKAGNSYTAITDSKGHFRFNRITLDSYTSVLTAEINGYFKSYRVFSASQKGTNFIKIQLLKKTAAGTINGNTGGSVTTTAYTITLPATGVINKNTGAVYSGNVTVFAQYINPTAANISAIVPGNMIGIDSTTKRVKLQSLGMVAVELQGSGGEVLQIATGKAATLKIEIPSSYVAKAPATIPLWYVDEQTGVWKEEGVATKTGSSYIGSVKHFSFWNCDIPFVDMVYLEMTIHDLQNHPLPYTIVEIRTDSASADWAIPAYGYTDSIGHIGGLVPANFALLVNVKNECYSIASTHHVNALTQNTDLGTLTENTSSYEVTIGGTVKNCTGQAVTDGWIDIFLDDKSYVAPVNATGVFSLSILHCNNNLTVIANDVTGRKSGLPLSFTIGTDNVSNLSLTACDVPFVSYVVSTIAGSDTGFINGTGSAARLHYPEDVAVDADGNVYVADLVNYAIRKITPTGVVTTFAGSGRGYADGPGNVAKFYNPGGLAIDAAGNIIVADGGNSRIRKITPAGVVSTIAGDGSFAYADGTGTAAKFFGPSAIDIDKNGNIIVCDYGNHRIRTISPAGVVTTIAGDGTLGYLDGQGTAAKFNFPTGVTVDKNGNIYVADRSNNRIRKISPTGLVTTIAGDGTEGFADGIGTATKFTDAWGVTTDTLNNVYVGDYNNNRIRKISPSAIVTTIAGGNVEGSQDGPGLSARFYGPQGLKVDVHGNIYVADRNNSRIRKLTPQ